MSERDLSLEDLTRSILAGSGDEARRNAFAALAKGSTKAEVLDAIVEAASIVCDLQELGQYDHSRLSAVEKAVAEGLQAVEDWLLTMEGKYNVKVTVGPVGVKAGVLAATAVAASLRSIGMRSTVLGKTQTALDLLRNSEELDADLVIPLLSGDGDQQLREFVEAYERGGFKNKFEVIAIAPGMITQSENYLTVATNTEEAISRATQWALSRSKRGA